MLKTTRLFRKACLLAALLIAVAPAAAEAQVFQQGTVTTGHVPIWSTNNVIRDAGSAANGNISELGIKSSSGVSLGIISGATTSAYTQFGVGVVPGTGVQITDTAFGGATHVPMNFVVNGNTTMSITDTNVLVNGVPIGGATIPNNTLLGNVSGSTAAPGAITGTQVSTMLGLGTAAFVNLGTSGATIPLLSTANTWSQPQTFGVNLGTGGSLVLSGATSGSATVNVAAVAGTGTVFRLPASNGTSTYFLQTDGAGITSWQPVSASVFTGILLGANGGTGVANTGKTITLGGDLTTSGAFTTTLTVTGATTLTLPTSGTVTALGNTVTGSGSLVLATAPALVTPALGVATATSLAIGGAAIGSNGLAVTGHLLLEGVTSTGATGTGNLVFSASPTFTGTAVAATLNATNFNGIFGATTPAAGTFTTVTANTSVTTAKAFIGGATSAPSIGGVSTQTLVSAALGAGASRSASRWDNSNAPITDYFAKSKSGTIGTPGTAVVTGTDLYLMRIYGDDGTSLVESSRISFDATGTVATGQVPGLMDFWVANSSGSLSAPMIELTPGAASFGGFLNSESLRVVPVASAVNHFNVNGSTTGNSPIIYVDGSDPNAGGILSSNGTGSVGISAGQGARKIAAFVDAASGDNFIFTRGTNPTISTSGGNLAITPTAVFGAQIQVTAMTQTSAAQSGTVCYNSGTGAITYDATVGCLTSSGRFKDVLSTVRPNDALATVMALRAVSFRYKPGVTPDTAEQFGFIAEEVAAVDPRMVGYGPDGLPRGVRYQEAVAVLAAAIQAQQAEIDGLKASR